MTTKLRLNQIAPGGWESISSATYASADGPTQVITVPAGAASIYSPGMRLKYTQSQALTSYWTLDSSSSDSVGSNNGTDTNITYTSGKFSNAATFNGTSSKIVLADSSSLKPTGEFTLGCWFKTNATGAYRTLFQSMSVNTNVAGFKLGISSLNVLFFNAGNNTSSTIYTNIAGTTTVTDNVFHYAVVSYRNNYVQIYLDGKLEISSYCFTPSYAATNYVRIGCKNDAGSDGDYFSGQIDDLFLINGYALDEATIKAKYAAGTAQGTGAITVQKYALITAVADTALTVYSGTDYSVQNATISSPYYSTVASPFGFPKDPNKWTVTVSDIVDRIQSSPTQNTWYNLGGISISVPIGCWNLSHKVQIGSIISSGTGTNVFLTLSTGNNTESNPDFTLTTAISGATGNVQTYLSVVNNEIMLTFSKIPMYLNCKTSASGVTIIGLFNSSLKAIIRAISAYL